MFCRDQIAYELKRQDAMRAHSSRSAKRYASAHVEKRRAQARAWCAEKVRDPEEWPRMAIKRLRQKAVREGVPFKISRDDIVVPPVCPITLLPFVLGQMRHPHGPSVDRLVPSIGYVPGNVRVISVAANRAKNDITDADMFRRLALYVDGNL